MEFVLERACQHRVYYELVAVCVAKIFHQVAFPGINRLELSCAM